MATKKKTKPVKHAPKKRLTKAEMRVAIARDVIASLNAKKLVASPGTYLGVSNTEYDRIFDISAPYGLPEEPIAFNGRCTVCAIGSVFVATVNRFDKLTTSAARDAVNGYSEEMITYLSKWFSELQLRLMEDVFEGYTNGTDEAARRYHNKTFAKHGFKKAPEILMRAIMRNIIRNNGTFVTPGLK